MPVFTRPISISRSRSSTCSVDTPPLSPVASSFQSEGSQSSIDFAALDVVLSAATYAVNCEARTRARARPRGAGHRRHTSRVPPLPTSVYETIEEEFSSGAHSSALLLDVKNALTAPQQSVIVVDAETASIDLDVKSAWDDEKGIITLRKFYALRDEADNTLEESRRVWEDTPFSVSAVQCKLGWITSIISLSLVLLNFFVQLSAPLSIRSVCRRFWTTLCKITVVCLPNSDPVPEGDLVRSLGPPRILRGVQEHHCQLTNHEPRLSKWMRCALRQAYHCALSQMSPT
jgi:hypothetical protein